MDLISEVSEELAYYIYAEKKACLPGLGCFEAVYESATLDPSNDILKAPSEHIRFGIASSDDYSFVDHLTKQLANREVYEDFKQKVIELMSSNTRVALPGLGLFIANSKGEIQFEEERDDEFNFDFEDLKLKLIPAVENPAENAATNAPSAAIEPAAQKGQVKSFVGIGMLAIVSALCLAILFPMKTNDEVQAIAKQVNLKNVNISPIANQNEVYIAAESPSAMAAALKTEERAEIIQRQDAMTADLPVAAPQYKAELITNTFSSRKNIDRQIERIESLGYQSAELERGSGLVATMIILSYTEEKELNTLLEEVKQDFPKAKIHK